MKRGGGGGSGKGRGGGAAGSGPHLSKQEALALSEKKIRDAEELHGFTLTEAEKAHFRKLDAKEEKMKRAATGKPPGKTRSAPATKKPRIAQEKADLLSLMEQVLDEDGDDVVRGHKGGDAPLPHQEQYDREFDNTLEAVVRDRSATRSVDAIGARAASAVEGIDVMAETRPPCLNGTSDATNDMTPPLLRYVSPPFIPWLEAMEEYDNLEINFLQPLQQGHHLTLPAGTGLDLCNVVEWAETHMGIDLWRAVIHQHEKSLFHNKTSVPAAVPSSPSLAPINLMSLDALDAEAMLVDEVGRGRKEDEEEGEPWFVRMVEDAMRQKARLAHTAALPELDCGVAALDFTLDKKARFLVRFVYVIAAITGKNNNQNDSRFMDNPWLTQLSVFQTSLKLLGVHEPGVNVIVQRSAVLNRQPKALDAATASDEKRQVIRPLSMIKATYAGYYYHTPKETLLLNDQRIHSTIKNEFIFSS